MYNEDMMYDEDYYLESVLFPWLDDCSMEDYTEDPYYEENDDEDFRKDY